MKEAPVIGQDAAQEKKEPEKQPEKEQEKVPEKQEQPIDRAKLLEEAQKEIEDLQKDFDTPEEEWMQKMHKALEREALLRSDEFDLEAQDKKTKELMDKVQKKQEALKEGDDRKPLEDAEKELGDQLKQTAKDRSALAARVENAYGDELRKRKEALEDKEKEERKAHKGETAESKKLKESADRFKERSDEAYAYSSQLEAEVQEPKENIFTSAFMKTFSGWLPGTVFDMLGAAFGGQGGRVVKVVQVPLDDPFYMPSFFEDKNAIKPTGPESTLALFKGTEQMKEKASEEILKTDRNADLNFDGIDKAAKETAQRLGEQQQKAQDENVQKDNAQKENALNAGKNNEQRVNAEKAEEQKAHGFKIQQGPKMTTKDQKLIPIEALQEVPHAGEPMHEAPKKEEPKKEEVKQAGQANLQPKKGSGLKASQLQSVNHVEIKGEPEKAEEATRDTNNTVQQEQPKAEQMQEEVQQILDPKRETPKEEVQDENEKAKPWTNAQKANKLMGIFEALAGADSKYHMNSGKFESMMDAYKKVQETMEDTFGTLERDFGHLPNFKALSQPGGPLDLALKGPLEELEKKTEAYINEKTHNGIKTHMGSGLGNARIKSALDGLAILNPERAKELGDNIRIDVKDGKASRRMTYNELIEKDKPEAQKEAEKEKVAQHKKRQEEAAKKKALEDPVKKNESKPQVKMK